jgi:TatD DNase family protein
MRFFDSHAHLSAPPLLEDIDPIADRAQRAEVGAIVNICTDLDSLDAGLSIARRHPFIANAGATTPHDAEQAGEAHFPRFAEAARSGSLVAIGETGLDYFHYRHTRLAQQRLLSRYLALAAECKLPVVFHCRDAFSDLFAQTAAEYPRGAPALLHCFTGTLEEAEEALARNWSISLSGIVTFKKSAWLREIARMIPLDRLLIETDAPYLSPESRRSRRNEPAFLQETAECLAGVKEVSLAELARATFDNGVRFFQFPLSNSHDTV